MDESTLRIRAQEIGFRQMALCPTDGFEREREMVREQEKLAERRQLRFMPLEDYPQAKSLAVLLWPYLQAEIPQGERLFVDSYYAASNAAYHAAKELEGRLLAEGCFAKANVSYPAKEAAVRAGLGIIGRSSLLITPQYGTRVVIILMATDIEACTGRAQAEHEASCIGCGRCRKACPTGAIDESGMSHPERCLRNYMMEGNITPEAVRRKIGMRLLGCDICQRVCPMQPNRGETPSMDIGLEELMTTEQRAFSEAVARIAGQIGRNAARPQRIRAQAALLAGNSGNAAYLPVLREWAQSPFESVREHACWSIEQIEQAHGGLDRIGKTR